MNEWKQKLKYDLGPTWYSIQYVVIQVILLLYQYPVPVLVWYRYQARYWYQVR